MSDETPTYLKDYFPVSGHIASGDGHGNQLLHSFNRRFAMSSAQLPPCALPALLPGQFNIVGVDGYTTRNIWSQPNPGGVVFVDHRDNLNPSYAWTYRGGSVERVQTQVVGYENPGDDHQAPRYFPFGLDAHKDGLVVISELGLQSTAPYDTAYWNYSLDYGLTWAGAVAFPLDRVYATDVSISPDASEFFIAHSDYQGGGVRVHRFAKQEDGSYAAAGTTTYGTGDALMVAIAAVGDGKIIGAYTVHADGPAVMFGEVAGTLTIDHALDLDAYEGVLVCAGTELRQDPEFVYNTYSHIYVNGVLLYETWVGLYGSGADVSCSSTVHTDRLGNWVVGLKDNLESCILVSYDNAVTWEKFTVSGIGHWYGLAMDNGDVYVYGSNTAVGRINYTQVFGRIAIDRELHTAVFEDMTNDTMGKASFTDDNLPIAAFR